MIWWDAFGALNFENNLAWFYAKPYHRPVYHTGFDDLPQISWGVLPEGFAY